MLPGLLAEPSPDWRGYLDADHRPQRRLQYPAILSTHGPAGDLRAAHDAAERAGVVDGEVLADAVVPEGDRACLPAEAAGELGPVAVLEQISEQRLALRLRHAFEAHRVGGVDVEQLAPRLGMRDHHRVRAHGLAQLGALTHLGGP